MTWWYEEIKELWLFLEYWRARNIRSSKWEVNKPEPHDNKHYPPERITRLAIEAGDWLNSIAYILLDEGY